MKSNAICLVRIATQSEPRERENYESSRFTSTYVNITNNYLYIYILEILQIDFLFACGERGESPSVNQHIEFCRVGHFEKNSQIRLNSGGVPVALKVIPSLEIGSFWFFGLSHHLFIFIFIYLLFIIFIIYIYLLFIIFIIFIYLFIIYLFIFIFLSLVSPLFTLKKKRFEKFLFLGCPLPKTQSKLILCHHMLTHFFFFALYRVQRYTIHGKGPPSYFFLPFSLACSRSHN